MINPAHAKALKGHKTDAKDAIRLLDLYECGLLSGSYIPDRDLSEVRDRCWRSPRAGSGGAGHMVICSRAPAWSCGSWRT